jgi:hypothetical protein
MVADPEYNKPAIMRTIMIAGIFISHSVLPLPVQITVDRSNHWPKLICNDSIIARLMLETKSLQFRCRILRTSSLRVPFELNNNLSLLFNLLAQLAYLAHFLLLLLQRISYKFQVFMTKS